jgi:glycosyltransferase involved in cell wall biosynthesis
MLMKEISRRPRRIAFLGTRGVPANYGGFETFVQEIGERLAASGDEVTIYGRSSSVSRSLHTFRGMRLVVLPAPRHKYLETVIHTLFSAFHALRGRFDLIYICNVANVPAAAVLILFRRRVLLNVDGLEWRRKKWGATGRLYYRACSYLAAHLPFELASDADVIERYYRETYGRQTMCIPYGTRLNDTPDDGTLARLTLEPGRYVLYVSRLEPENNAHVVIEAYRHVRSDLPLVVVGDAPYASRYIARLQEAAAADPRVHMVGAIYGEGYHVLQSNAACYVQATEVGGTHPALVEAMGQGAAIIANDVPEHREVLGSAGLYYSGAEMLTKAIEDVLSEPELRSGLAGAARERARQRYSWDSIAQTHFEWFDRLLRRSGA